MRVILIGEASTHHHDLVEHMTSSPDIIQLPQESAIDARHDGVIGGDDVVVSLRFTRPQGQMPQFRLLHVPGAGLDGIDLAALFTTTTVCNVFEHEIPIAEYTLGCLIEFETRASATRRGFTAETWSDRYRAREPHGEVFGKTLGLLGYGRIGRAIAQRAQAFGIEVVAFDRHLPPDHGLAAGFSPGELIQLLELSDYVVVACPLTEQTRGMLNRETLGHMKPTSLLVNISRAQIVDEQALFTALSDRTIAGAFLDVWYQYPLGRRDRVPPSNVPFLDLPNVWGSPHVSAWTHNLSIRRYRAIARNIDRLISGAPLENVVQGPCS
jgi:phosphoglycerate dehydrogenase-like enzyme